jgi:hypothetical protein
MVGRYGEHQSERGSPIDRQTERCGSLHQCPPDRLRGTLNATRIAPSCPSGDARSIVLTATLTSVLVRTQDELSLPGHQAHASPVGNLDAPLAELS